MTARDVPAPRSGLSAPSDEDALVAAVRTGDEAALRELMGRLNRRLFRVARALVGDDAEAEEVVQETWLAALAHLDRFRGEARFATWLTRICLNAARMRRRAERRRGGEGPAPGDGERMGAQVLPFPGRTGETPEEAAERRQVRRLLEEAVDELPPELRLVFVLHEVEGVDVRTVARELSLHAVTVRTRLFRARRRLRRILEQRVGGGFDALFPFDGPRCAALVERVLAARREGRGRPASRGRSRHSRARLLRRRRLRPAGAAAPWSWLTPPGGC